VIYLSWYLGVGIVVLTALYVTHKIRSKHEPRSFHDILESTNPDRDKLSYKIFNNVAVPLLALCIWPLAFFLMIQEHFQAKNNDYLQELPVFSVKREYLTIQTAKDDIELQEMIFDPLDATPALPFGHLNEKWEKFISSAPEGCQIWTFEAKWEPAWGGAEFRKGYVCVENEVPGAYFLAVRKRLSDYA
jgi:hypothetical protein